VVAGLGLAQRGLSLGRVAVSLLRGEGDGAVEVGDGPDCRGQGRVLRLVCGEGGGVRAGAGDGPGGGVEPGFEGALDRPVYFGFDVRFFWRVFVCLFFEVALGPVSVSVSVWVVYAFVKRVG